GRMNVMIATVPSEFSHVHPAPECKIYFYGINSRWHIDHPCVGLVFRTAAEINPVSARRQKSMLTIGTINLRLKKEVGVFVSCCQSSGRKGIDANELVF